MPSGRVKGSDLEAARRIAFLLTKGAAAAADAVH